MTFSFSGGKIKPYLFLKTRITRKIYHSLETAKRQAILAFQVIKLVKRQQGPKQNDKVPEQGQEHCMLQRS